MIIFTIIGIIVCIPLFLVITALIIHGIVLIFLGITVLCIETYEKYHK